MVLRQIFTGLMGGVILALLALFLTVPRALVEKEAPAWLLEKLPIAVRGEDALAMAEPDSSSGDSIGAEASESDATDSPAGTPVSVQGNPPERALVASLGDEAILLIEEPQDTFEDEFHEESLAIPQADELDPNSLLGALSKQTIIRRAPDPHATIIGFARTGALLRRAQIPAGHEGCKEGWYRVEPDGYICVGKAATLDSEHPIIRLASLQPDRSLAMPYPYGMSRYPTPPLYTQIPTEKQQRIAEQDLPGHLKKNFASLWAESADTPPPQLLAEGERIPRPYGYPRLARDFMTGRALGSSSFAFIDLFESGGRKWGLTTDLSLLPLDRLKPVEISNFTGKVLQGEQDLPLVFVRSRKQFLYEGSPAEGTLRRTQQIAYRDAFHLTGEEAEMNGVRFLQVRGGAFIKEDASLVRVDRRSSMPKWAKNERSWVEVSILDQTLVAYRGTVPLFATLVSTGKDGLGDPETTHSTARGVFLIHTKHVTSSMSGNAADDEFDLRDVPYVQYFHGGFALHAAFWHDAFGQPRSHGCVNLSPRDARHLFSVTDPPVPMRWHSALDMHGTLVYVHP